MFFGKESGDTVLVGRRRFLTLAGAAATGAVAGTLLPAMPPSGEVFAAVPVAPTKSLSLFNVNTQETLSGTFWKEGAYDGEMLRRLDVLLRDHRANQICHMDAGLFDILAGIQQRLGNKEPLRVICGYRSSQTNAMARRRSKGVAKESYHVRGMAVDIAVPNTSLKAIAAAARDAGAGGIGIYNRSGFVHVDVGPRRSW